MDSLITESRISNHEPGPRTMRNASERSGHGSIAQSDDDASSEDEPPDPQEILTEDIQAIIGVSISQTQARLTSPQTPAAEKAAAVRDGEGYFSDRLAVHPADDTCDSNENLSKENTVNDSLDSVGGNNDEVDPSSRQLHSQRQELQPVQHNKQSRSHAFRNSISEALLQHSRKSSLGNMTRKLNGISLPSLPKSLPFSASSIDPSFSPLVGTCA